MVDAILMLLKDSVEDAVQRNSGIPSNRKEIAIEMSMKVVADSFRAHFASDDMVSIASLFTGRVDINSSLVINNLVSYIANGLLVQVGITTKGGDIAKHIVSDVIANIWKKMNSSESSGITLDNFVYVFSGRRVQVSARDNVSEIHVNNANLVMA